MTTSDSERLLSDKQRKFLRLSSISLEVLFVLTLLLFLGSLVGNKDYFLEATWLEMGMGVLQWLHALAVGHWLDSHWHRRYFKIASIYVALALLLGGMFMLSPSLGGINVFLF